jgi:hypothetical protein
LTTTSTDSLTQSFNIKPSRSQPTTQSLKLSGHRKLNSKEINSNEKTIKDKNEEQSNTKKDIKTSKKIKKESKTLIDLIKEKLNERKLKKANKSKMIKNINEAKEPNTYYCVFGGEWLEINQQTMIISYFILL